jgi:acyl carrier protein
MQSHEQLEAEIKKLIVEALVLEDLAPEDIDSDGPLFGEGLALDSIDVLEIAIALEQRYGVVLDGDEERNREHFACVRSLARFVAETRAT